MTRSRILWLLTACTFAGFIYRLWTDDSGVVARAVGPLSLLFFLVSARETNRQRVAQRGDYVATPEFEQKVARIRRALAVSATLATLAVLMAWGLYYAKVFGPWNARPWLIVDILVLVPSLVVNLRFRGKYDRMLAEELASFRQSENPGAGARPVQVRG